MSASVAAAIAATVLALPGAAAAATFTAGIGHTLSDSVPDQSMCAEGSFLTGIEGRIGSVFGNPVVADVTAVCESGPVSGPLSGWTGPVVGTGSTQCPEGARVSGIQGRGGDLVDQLQVRCRVGAGPATDAAPFGSPTGGDPAGPFDCPEGTRAIGLDGTIRNGLRPMDFVRLVCGPVLPETKNDCKDGGWATYNRFANQGDCVSYIATREKNSASGA